MNKKNREFIESELGHLSETIDAINETLAIPKWNRIEKSGTGGFLANMYHGYENIFRTLTEDRGIRIPKGEKWHSDLLDCVKIQGFVPAEMSNILRGMLGFRHLQVHGYAYMLNEEKLRANSAEVVENHPIFVAHIKKILDDA